MFSGPVAESLPTSVSAFHRRRPRADSTTSFTYYQGDEDDEDEPEILPGQHDRAHRDSLSDVGDMRFGEEDEDSLDIEDARLSDEYILRRRSSTFSRSSVHDRLLRTDSSRTFASGRMDGRQSQKVYMVNEDLTIAIAGFRTSRIGHIVYVLLCICSLGLAWLLLRWLPRWHVKLLGQPCALGASDWVVIEVRESQLMQQHSTNAAQNSWGEMVVLDVEKKLYGRPMSTIFGSGEKVYAMDDDPDPIVDELRMLNYRYVRLFYHQQKDQFVLFNGWKDPNWTNIRAVRAGLDSDEKHVREVVFGRNDIDIEQKSISRLLVDEV